MERRCIICGKKETVRYKRLTESGRYYHVCDICKARIQKEAKEQQEYKKPI